MEISTQIFVGLLSDVCFLVLFLDRQQPCLTTWLSFVFMFFLFSATPKVLRNLAREYVCCSVILSTILTRTMSVWAYTNIWKWRLIPDSWSSILILASVLPFPTFWIIMLRLAVLRSSLFLAVLSSMCQLNTWIKSGKMQSTFPINLCLAKIMIFLK